MGWGCSESTEVMAGVVHVEVVAELAAEEQEVQQKYQRGGKVRGMTVQT